MTSTEINFKNNLVKLRQQSGLSKYKICKDIGLSYGSYSRLEDYRKETVPSFATMEKLAAYYGVTVSSLFDF